MKRRILSLLIVLCVAISLLAVSAFAAVPSITVTMNGLEWKNVEQGTSLYAITTSSTDANGYLTGTATECLETDNWNIHLDYTGEVPVLYLQNATLSNVETINEDETITLGNALTVTTNGAFVLNSVEGTTNTLYNKSDENGWSTSEVPLALNAKLGTTITGTGKLIGEARTYVRYTGPIISTSYELTFKDADVDLVSRQYDYGAINTGANVTFDGGNVKLSSGNGTVLIKRSSANSVVTVKNGANVQLTGNGNSPVITNTGDVIVENSTLEYTNINSGWASGELPVFPKTSGTHLVEYKLTSDKNTVRSFLSTDEADADYIAGGTNMSATDTGMDAIDKGVYYLKITHVHTTAGGCTEGGACLDCGAAVAPKANHAFDNDCTTADKCANCAVVAEANAAHVFDDNCTTADKCANCEAVASAVAAHSFTNKASDQLAKAATTTTLAAYYVQCDNCEVVSDTKTVKAGQYAITVEMLGLTWTDIAEGTHKYATTDAETQTATECTESDNWNIHLDYTTGKTPTLYLKGATLKAAVNAEANGIAALKVTTNGAFVLNSAAGTTNTLTNDVQASYNSYAMNFLAKGGTTITGSGLLVGNTTQGGNSAAPMRTCYDLTLKDANVELSTAAAYQPCIAVAGGWDHESQIPGLVVIDGGNVKLTNMANGRGIAYLQNGWGQSVSNNSTLTTKTVTIKNNANVQIIGSGNANPIGAAGGVIVENATLEIDMTANGGQTGWISAELPKFPTINGTHQVEYIVANNLNVTKSFLSTDTADADYIAAGTDMTAVDSYLQYLKISHVHNVEGGCTAGGTCVDCGAEVEAKAHSYADDGDCTTAVNCSVCGKVVIPATEHVAQEGTYICTDAIPCVNCDKNFREAGNHTPNADDGDCTSAITCSVCDAVTTPAESAHKYTDLDDTTCDNAGCIATRLAGLHATISGVNMDTVYGETKYATMGANGAVALVGVDDAWNIKIDFTDDVPVLSLQNITATGGSFNLSGKGALQIDVLTDVTITGNNVFTLAMEGGTTISSPTNGLLTVNMSSTSGTKLLTVPVGALTFKNANVAFSAVRSSKYTAGEYAAVDVAGDVVFSGGTATITGSGSNMALKVGGDLTVEKGANVTLLSDGYGSAADVTGEIKVIAATLTGRHSWGSPSATKWLFNKIPTVLDGVNAVYSESQWNWSNPAYQKALTAETDILDCENNKIYYIAFAHSCVADDCTEGWTCVHGLEFAAKAAHTFDNNCTTADKCANCSVVTEANATHNLGDLSVTAGACQNPNCEFVNTASVEIFNEGGATKWSKKVSVGEVFYATNDENGVVSETTEEVGDWTIKFEYPVDGVPTLTFKGAKIQGNSTGHGMTFGSTWSNFKVVVLEDSEVNNGTHNCFWATSITGDVIIEGAGKLTLRSTSGNSPYGCPLRLGNVGDAYIQNANLEIIGGVYIINAETGQKNGTRSGIIKTGGNLIIDNSEVNFDNPFGNAIWMLEKMNAEGKVSTEDYKVIEDNVSKKDLIIRNGSVITGTTNSYGFGVSGDLTVADSTVEMTCGNGVFATKPTLEGVTAIGGLSANKTIAYNENRWSMFRYIKIVPGEDVVLVGDINGDGSVNSLDSLVLAKHLADWADYSDIDLLAADVNGDGKVTNIDYVILERHIAGWEGYETLPAANAG